MKNRLLLLGAVVAMLPLAMAVSYLTTYLVLLRPTVASPGLGQDWEPGDLHDLGYRPDGPAVRSIFAPAHWLDQKLRPHYWNLPFTYSRIEEVEVPGPHDAREALSADQSGRASDE